MALWRFDTVNIIKRNFVKEIYSRMVRVSDCQIQSRDSPVGSISQHASDVESEGRQTQQCWINYVKQVSFTAYVTLSFCFTRHLAVSLRASKLSKFPAVTSFFCRILWYGSSAHSVMWKLKHTCHLLVVLRTLLSSVRRAQILPKCQSINACQPVTDKTVERLDW